MTKNNIKNYFVMFVLIFSASSMIGNHAFATPPTDPLNLGQAGTYAILSGNVAGVITNGVPGQFIGSGNVGHTSTETAPFTFAAGFGDVSNPAILGTIATPGTPIGDAHVVLTNIGTWDGTTNTGIACTFTFAPGAIDLATDTTHGPIGVYTPGVYCINGAASIGTAGITLSGAGPYVFKINGALTTVSGSTVTFNGAAGCSNANNAGNLFWAPVGGASTGATSQFSGTILSGSAAITTGANTDNTNSRFISESAITIGGGANLFSIPATPCGVGQSTTERMTGGGSVIDPAGNPTTRVTHGFELYCDVTKGPNNLEVNWGNGNNFHLTSLTSATCTDDPSITPNPPAAGFDTYHGTGTGTLNGVAGATIDFTFTDAGEPGTSDHATIIINGGATLSVSGNLQNGNQQAHK
jgi:hypothetical protein